MLIATTVFAMAVIGVIVHHMLQLHQPGEIGAWTSAIQTIGAILVGLAGLPYTANRLTGGLESVVAAIKKRGE
jgi:hypothetical protein